MSYLLLYIYKIPQLFESDVYSLSYIIRKKQHQSQKPELITICNKNQFFEPQLFRTKDDLEYNMT